MGVAGTRSVVSSVAAGKSAEAASGLLGALPAPPDYRPRMRLRRLVDESGLKIAVVDDDPTGTQTVRDVPLVTSWDEDELDWAMRVASPTFAILTNSRAMSPERAVETNLEVGRRLAQVARRQGVEVRAISRSDSTLRGHFPGEPEALAAGLEAGGPAFDAILVCPAFPEAGRITVDDVHWIERDGRLIGAGESEFATDPAFGYRSSNLLEWVRERAGTETPVASIDLRDLRTGGSAAVARFLLEARGRARYVVANAAAPTDLDVIALGVEEAERLGMRMLYRTGPSFVSARAGRPTAFPLGDEELATTTGAGLLVVGSHTELTSSQLRGALERHRLTTVSLDVDALLSADPDAAAALVRNVGEELIPVLAEGKGAALVTSRRPAHRREGVASLRDAGVVADALVEIVAAVTAAVRLDWLVAKGGITSHDVAVRALRARRAVVLGQLFSGQVSVWELGEGCVQPGLRYVVFPGNVGDEMALAETLSRLGCGS